MSTSTNTTQHHYRVHRQYLHHRDSKLLESIREVILGLEDGLISTLGVIVGVAAGTGSSRIVILSGIVAVFAEALSMAAGTYLSHKTEQQLQEVYLREEEEEIKRWPRVELQEAHRVLIRRGYSKEERRIIMKRLRDSRNELLEFLTQGKVAMKRRGTSLAWATVIMWLANIIGGILAVSAYLMFPLMVASVAAVAIVGLTLFALGAMKGLLFKLPWFISGIEMMVISLIAAGLGHSIGWFVQRFLLS